MAINSYNTNHCVAFTGIRSNLVKAGRIVLTEGIKLSTGAACRPDNPIRGAIASKVAGDMIEANYIKNKSIIERLKFNPFNIFSLIGAVINKCR